MNHFDLQDRNRLEDISFAIEMKALIVRNQNDLQEAHMESVLEVFRNNIRVYEDILSKIEIYPKKKDFDEEMSIESLLETMSFDTLLKRV